MKIILVTGGYGFIGCHFIRLLLDKREYRVINLDKLTYAGNIQNLEDLTEGSRYRFARADITDGALVDALFKEEKPWAVVNFAAESHVDRSILSAAPFLQTNIIGVHVLLEAARRHNVERFVQISTDEVYGDAEGREPFDESSALFPSSPYSASKAAADQLCLAFKRTYGSPILIVRSSNNYGPFQLPEKLIPLMIRNTLKRQHLPLYDDGLQRRDWLYVEDNCQAILEVLERGSPGQIYNVATGEERTNLEVTQALCGLMAEEAGLNLHELLRLIRFVADRPGHDRRYASRTERIRQEIGWSPKVPFHTGLKRTINWYSANRDWINQVTSGEYEQYYETVYRHAWRDTSR